LRWISVVTKETGVRNFATEVGMIGAVVSRAHPPVSAALGIPAHGKLDEPASLVAMEKRLRMISRADDVVDSFLQHIGRARLKSPRRDRDFVAPRHGPA